MAQAAYREVTISTILVIGLEWVKPLGPNNQTHCLGLLLQSGLGVGQETALLLAKATC